MRVFDFFDFFLVSRYLAFCSNVGPFPHLGSIFSFQFQLQKYVLYLEAGMKIVNLEAVRQKAQVLSSSRLSAPGNKPFPDESKRTCSARKVISETL